MASEDELNTGLDPATFSTQSHPFPHDFLNGKRGPFLPFSPAETSVRSNLCIIPLATINPEDHLFLPILPSGWSASTGSCVTVSVCSSPSFPSTVPGRKRICCRGAGRSNAFNSKDTEQRETLVHFFAFNIQALVFKQFFFHSSGQFFLGTTRFHAKLCP